MRTRIIETPDVAKATGTGAIALSYTHATIPFTVTSVAVRLSAVPAVAGSLTVTLDSVDGAAYDVVLASLDPSTAAAMDIVVWFDAPGFVCQPGDAIAVAYANPSAVTYGAAIRTRLVG